MSDYQLYIIDVNLEEYFEDNFSSQNKIGKVLLNPSRRSHREIFCNVLEEQLNVYQLENKIHNIAQFPIREEIEYIDELITRILNIARKKVEGMKRGVPYSLEKARIRDTILYWKAHIRRNKKGIVNVEVMEKRRNLHNIDTFGEKNIKEVLQKL